MTRKSWINTWRARVMAVVAVVLFLTAYAMTLLYIRSTDVPGGHKENAVTEAIFHFLIGASEVVIPEGTDGHKREP